MTTHPAHTITIALETSDPQLASRIRDEILATLQSINPLECGYQIGLPERKDSFTKVLGELVQ